MSAYAATAAGLARALGDVAESLRKPDAIDRAIAAMPERARAAVEKLIDALAADYCRRPYLIARALHRPAFWPPDEPLDVLLADCRARLAEARKRGDNMFAIENLMAAERALERIIAEGDGLPKTPPGNRERP